MAKISVKQLKNDIKSKNFYNCYLLYGDEKYIISKLTRALIDSIYDRNISDFDFSDFDPLKTAVEDISDFLFTFPVMSQYKCALINDLDITSLKKDETEAFKELIKTLPSEAVLIVSLKTINPDEKNREFKNFLKAIETSGVSCKIDFLSQAELTKFIMSYVKKKGCTISLQNVYRLIENCEPNLSNVINELSKLCSLKSGSEILSYDIDKMVSKNIKTTVFAFSKSVLNNNLSNSLKLLNVLLENKEKPNIILSVLAYAYIDVLRAKLAVQYAISDNELIQAFNFDYKGREFKLRNAKNLAPRYTLDQLKQCIDLLFKADMSIKLTQEDPKIVLQKLLVKLSLVYKGDYQN